MKTITELTKMGGRQSVWGEGPIWDGNVLHYVDIEDHKVITFDPATGGERVADAGERVGTVVPRADADGLVIAGDNGFAHFDPDTGEKTPITDPEPDITENRFNDGKCDPQGRFWAGTINMAKPERQPLASLYKLDHDGTCTRMFGPVINSNGIVWSEDGKTMFYIDTPRLTVLAFDFDGDAGTISNERTVVDTTGLDGVPDGMAIDAEGQLWVAMCKGSAVHRFDPATGDRTASVELPCSCPTAPAFGGDDLRTLYITTGMRDGEPDAGYLYACTPGVSGLPSFPFAG